MNRKEAMDPLRGWKKHLFHAAGTADAVNAWQEMAAAAASRLERDDACRTVHLMYDCPPPGVITPIGPLRIHPIGFAHYERNCFRFPLPILVYEVVQS